MINIVETSFQISKKSAPVSIIITFHIRHSRGKMYSVVTVVCVSDCPLTHSHTTRWTRLRFGGMVGGAQCRIDVHYWTDLQSLHGLCCYDNIAPNAKCQWVLVLALCLVMVTLCNTADIIFLPCGFFLSSIFFFRRLISAVGDWMSTILPHMVWP